ncbi:MAG TPA: outer membrane lipoprotein-sorting protein [Thermoanaerobaculia bacterium]
MKRPVTLLVALVFAASPAFGESSGDVQGLLEAVDATRNAFDEAIISARATQVMDGKETGSANFDVYVKGRDKGLIVFRGGKNSGRKVLTNGDKMWLLVPGSTNPVPITPNQRLLGGASFGDVARLRFSEDYAAKATDESETVDGRSCRILELTGKSAKLSYPRVVLSVDDQAKLPCRVAFFLASGREARAVTFTKFRDQSGRKIVSEMEIRELLGAASRAVTRLEYRDYRVARLDPKIFTPEGARGL